MKDPAGDERDLGREESLKRGGERWREKSPWREEKDGTRSAREWGERRRRY